MQITEVRCLPQSTKSSLSLTAEPCPPGFLASILICTVICSHQPRAAASTRGVAPENQARYTENGIVCGDLRVCVSYHTCMCSTGGPSCMMCKHRSSFDVRCACPSTRACSTYTYRRFQRNGAVGSTYYFMYGCMYVLYVCIYLCMYVIAAKCMYVCM